MTLEKQITDYMHLIGFDATAPEWKSHFNVCLGFNQAMQTENNKRSIEVYLKKHAGDHVKILRLRKAGLSKGAIAREIKCSESTVKTTFKYYPDPHPKGAGYVPGPKALTQEEQDKIIELFDEGLSFKKIKLITGRSIKSIRKTLVKYGRKWEQKTQWPAIIVTDSDRIYIIYLHKMGLSCLAISQKINRSASVVYKVLRTAGVTPTQPKRITKHERAYSSGPNVTNEERVNILNLHTEGLYPLEISQKINRSQSIVYEVLNAAVDIIERHRRYLVGER